MERKPLYLVVGELVAVVLILGSFMYQERQKATGIDINVGRNGISFQTR